ncbi:hypothetical protein [Coprobacter sp.]
MPKYVLILYLLLPIPFFSGCDKNDDFRIPTAHVNIVISPAQWSRYGVHAFPDYQKFILNKVPNKEFYNISSATGYGGVLLVCGYSNQLYAYDLACPVERDPAVLLDIEDNHAYCPQCKSTYDIYGGTGAPTSGPAHEHKYMLRAYQVISQNGSHNIIN